jgi:hypothetical protein
MLPVKNKIYTMLTGDASLTLLLGGSDNIVSSWPEEILFFPVVIYQDENQSDSEFSDNKPTMSRIRYRIDVFTKSDSVTTTEIGLEIARIMGDDFFTCVSNGEVQDITEGVKHRVMRFGRELFLADIL